jgi:hypothetical protein
VIATWELWKTKPVVLQHVHFTGFGANGNGYAVLNLLHQLGVTADRYGDLLRIITPERTEAIAEADWWIVRGTRGEVYPVRPDVHEDKYERVQP